MKKLSELDVLVVDDNSANTLVLKAMMKDMVQMQIPLSPAWKRLKCHVLKVMI